MPPSVGPDDFTGLLFMQGNAAFYTKVHDAIDFLKADGAPAQARLIEIAYDKYMAKLTEIARDIAVKAREYIVEEEQASRVRPDTQGHGGDRLEEYIGESEPLGLPGSVGINNEASLKDSPVSWWWTNEEGYSGFVGDVIQGFFFDAGGGHGFVPSSHMSREHPIFRPFGTPSDIYNSNTPQGVIANPIPDRHFVERGYLRADREWHGLVGAARDEFMVELRRALATPAAP